MLEERALQVSLRETPSRVAKQQQLLVAQQDSETGSSSGASEKDAGFATFRKFKQIEARTSEKVAQGVHKGFRYLFTRNGRHASLPDWQANNFSGELNRVVRWYNKKSITDDEFLKDLNNIRQHAKRTE